MTAYLPNSGDALQINPYTFPTYANVHSDAYSTIQDLSVFLSALINGELVDKALLESLWQPALLESGSKIISPQAGNMKKLAIGKRLVMMAEAC